MGEKAGAQHEGGHGHYVAGSAPVVDGIHGTHGAAQGGPPAGRSLRPADVWWEFPCGQHWFVGRRREANQAMHCISNWE